jgi:hypothetical protein
MADKLVLRKEMYGTYLIQRLQKPQNFINPFSFGGGLVNGGFGKEAMDIIKNIYSFDYMGSSEFEWGAVPAAFAFLAEQADNKNLVANKIEIDEHTIGYICPKEYEEEVKNRIMLLRKEDIRLKEWCGLKNHFERGPFYNERLQPKGWIEIDNGWMFFTDKEMYENTLKLFGIKI